MDLKEIVFHQRPEIMLHLHDRQSVQPLCDLVNKVVDHLLLGSLGNNNNSNNNSFSGVDKAFNVGR
jgi:hypothetical protein